MYAPVRIVIGNACQGRSLNEQLACVTAYADCIVRLTSREGWGWHRTTRRDLCPGHYPKPRRRDGRFPKLHSRQIDPDRVCRSVPSQTERPYGLHRGPSRHCGLSEERRREQGGPPESGWPERRSKRARAERARLCQCLESLYASLIVPYQ